VKVSVKSMVKLSTTHSHGHWGHHNLFEGNVVHRMAAADWWSPCPNNVFFKNMATVDGIALKYASDQIILLDNAVAKYTAENNDSM
jgi:hypothetical protein